MSETILAIDSSIGISSVAVWRDGNIVAYLEDSRREMQASCLIPLIESALAQAGINYSDLSKVAVTVGPGSFTGIRIGLAAARGIAFASGINCAGFTSLEVMNKAGGELSIINAGKGEIYYQYFGKEKTEIQIDKLENIITKYPDSKIASSVSPAEITYPRADALAELAASKEHKSLPPLPLYIRPPDVRGQGLESGVRILPDHHNGA